MYLSLPVPTGRFGKTKCSLEQCLDGFVKEEVMEGENAWSVRAESSSLTRSALFEGHGRD